MQSLVDHARDELDRAGEEPGTTACLVAAVAAFDSYPHSGASHFAAAALLADLLNWRALTPLTADPDEWTDMSAISGVPLWQSRRDPRATSEDRGLSYTLTGNEAEPVRVHQAVAPPGWVRALRERDHIGEDDALTAVWAYLHKGPLDQLDQARLDRSSPADRSRYIGRRWGAQGAPVAWLLYKPQVPDA